MKKMTCQMSAREFIEYANKRMQDQTERAAREHPDRIPEPPDLTLHANIYEWLQYHPKGQPAIKLFDPKETRVVSPSW
jgi:hypothetical protein